MEKIKITLTFQKDVESGDLWYYVRRSDKPGLITATKDQEKANRVYNDLQGDLSIYEEKLISEKEIEITNAEEN